MKAPVLQLVFWLVAGSLSCASTATTSGSDPALASVDASGVARSTDSMLALCKAIIAGDRSVASEIERHPLVLKMSEGMAPQVTFTAGEFAEAAFSADNDQRFSFDLLRKSGAHAKGFADYVAAHKEDLLASGLKKAVEFLEVTPDPKTVTLNLVCGSPWDAFVLVFDEPELFFDLGHYADDVLEKALPGFESILIHELWHLAFLDHQKRHWPLDYRDSPIPETAFLYRMLNEGVGHYYSLYPKLYPGMAYQDFDQRIAKVFALLEENYPKYLQEKDPEQQRRTLLSSHAGVPFWGKWGAVPGALVVYFLHKKLGADAVRGLIKDEPFGLFIEYDEQSKKEPNWPRLPQALVASAKHGHEQHKADLVLLDSVYTTLVVPDALSEQKKQIAQQVVTAVNIKNSFAAAFAWEKESSVSLFDGVEFFATQAELWRRITQIHDLPPETPLPTPGLVAGLEGRILLAVTSQEYKRLQPEYAALHRSWTRLLAHEMIHRLHVEILNGDEDAMGPQWFYEGFAVIGSGQHLDMGLGFSSSKEALAAVQDTKTPPVYRRFAAASRYFMSKAPLPELVRRAADPDFEDWLLRL